MGVIVEDVESLLEACSESRILFEGKTVLVTGGAGFLGSWLCEVLVKQDCYVICIDNFSSGQRDNIKHLESLPSFSHLATPEPCWG